MIAMVGSVQNNSNMFKDTLRLSLIANSRKTRNSQSLESRNQNLTYGIHATKLDVTTCTYPVLHVFFQDIVRYCVGCYSRTCGQPRSKWAGQDWTPLFQATQEVSLNMTLQQLIDGECKGWFTK